MVDNLEAHHMFLMLFCVATQNSFDIDYCEGFSVTF